MLVGVFYRWNEGLPRLHSWPFYSLDFLDDGVALRPTSSLGPGRVRMSISNDDVAAVQRTRAGVRFVFADARSPLQVTRLQAREELRQAIQHAFPTRYDDNEVALQRWEP